MCIRDRISTSCVVCILPLRSRSCTRIFSINSLSMAMVSLSKMCIRDRHLTLEQLAEQTGLSKSALGKYETDDYKDISPFAIATLADFYGVSTCLLYTSLTTLYRSFWSGRFAPHVPNAPGYPGQR